MEVRDAAVILLQHGDRRFALRARDVVADVEVETDVLAEIEDGVERVHLRQVVRVVVEADPDLVLVRKRRHTRGEDGIAFCSHRRATESLGHEEVELDFLIRLPEAHLVDVNVHARVVEHLPHLNALGDLLLPLRIGDLATFDAREKLRRSAHELRLADAAVEQRLQRLLRRLRQAAIAIRDAADAHAIEDRVRLRRSRSESWKREASGSCDGGAEEMAAGERVSGHAKVERRSAASFACGNGCRAKKLTSHLLSRRFAAA